MIVICTCGQKNRLKAELATGATKAKEINCGHCKTPLAEIAKIQVDRNADIVLAIVELYHENKVGQFDIHHAVADIFKKNGMALGPLDIEDELDEDEDEDEDLEEEAAPKKKAKKKPATKKHTH